MSKKDARSGQSPKDAAINLMDKFITRNSNRLKDKPVLPGRRKDPDVPLNLWPLKDHIEYWESRTDEDRFDSEYSVYSNWYTVVKTQSGVYHATFLDLVSNLKPLMVEMWENKMFPKQAILELRKHGVY
tara:strand:- start:868 stop:1254 length:387 start_codon:yes stop_codon:yes gene_type:complete